MPNASDFGFSIQARVVELEAMNVANKNRIEELLEELARQSEEEDDHL